MRASRLGWGSIGALLAGAGFAAVGLSLTPEAIEDVSRTLGGEGRAPLQLAEIMLLEEDLMPDEEEEPEVASRASKQTKQDKSREGGNVRIKQVGEVTDSRVIGQVRARGVVDNLQQSQTGRANVQRFGAATVTDSHVVGSVDMNAHLQQGNQQQAGEGNQQHMNLGGLR